SPSAHLPFASIFDEHFLHREGEFMNFVENFILHTVDRYFLCAEIKANFFGISSFLTIKSNNLVGGTYRTRINIQNKVQRGRRREKELKIQNKVQHGIQGNMRFKKEVIREGIKEGIKGEK